MKRIMYIEYKGGGLAGPGRIGWVEFSRSRRSYYYGGKKFLKVIGYKHNCIREDGARYWISGPRRDGRDRLYGGMVEVDADARQQYWTEIRKQPQNVNLKCYRS